MTAMPRLPPAFPAGWLRRRPAGWAGLAFALACAAFYLHVARTALNPEVSEGYRRTFITGEFAVYPTSPVFRPADGLAYTPGAVVQVADRLGRAHLARFDWWRYARPKPWLKRSDGRVFLSVAPDLRRPDLPHRLRLGLTCAYPPGRGATLAIFVNGRAVAQAPCARGPVEIDAILPPGVFPTQAWEEIRIARPGLSWSERLAIRLGLRFDAVALDSFSVAPVE